MRVSLSASGPGDVEPHLHLHRRRQLRTSMLLLLLLQVVCAAGLLAGRCDATAATRIGSGYDVVSLSEWDDDTGLEALLRLNERTDDIYGPDVEFLRLTVRYETDARVHVKLVDANSSRWEIPERVLPRGGGGGAADPAASAATSALAVSVTRRPFSFAVTRKATGEVLFDTAPPAVTPATAARLASALESGRFDDDIGGDGDDGGDAAALRAHWRARAIQWSTPGSGAAAAAGDVGFLSSSNADDVDLNNLSGVTNSSTMATTTRVIQEQDSESEDTEHSEPSPPPLLFNWLVFKDQYLELSTSLDPATSSLYGIGESTRPDGLLLAPGRTYTLWNTDIFPNYTDVDLYGAFPYYLHLHSPSGHAHGVLLLNSNGMDVTYAGAFLTFRAIGGVLDLYFFAGPSPYSVTDQVTALAGRPAAVPYWALGLHQSRYGYKSVAELRDVVDGYKRAEIPVESIWSDIDCMDGFRVFTFHPEWYPVDGVRALLADLHAAHQRYVVIVDPGVKVDPPPAGNYGTYDRGVAAGVFVKNAVGGDYVAQVWPFAVHFPDFLHPDAQRWWTGEIARFHALAPFDGLWLDMNEPSNFCTGPVCEAAVGEDGGACYDPTVCCQRGCWDVAPEEARAAVDRWEAPPFRINVRGTYAGLGELTMAPSAVRHGGVREYDAHNLFGLLEAQATYRALREVMPGRRPFLISRSTFVGSGASAGHWTGDNRAAWADLRYSVVSVLNAGLVGVPLVGADICGFNEDTWEELCNRWVQLGAFYPLARVHSDAQSIPQELYRWPSVAATARAVLAERYRLLPYLYTLFFHAHATGAPPARPLFFEFPADPRARAASAQFLLGRALLVSPALDAGAESVRAYVPRGTWYDWFARAQMLVEPKGREYVVAAPADVVNVHVRAGCVVPVQEPAATTWAARRTPFSLVVAFSLLDAAEEAEAERESAEREFAAAGLWSGGGGAGAGAGDGRDGREETEQQQVADATATTTTLLGGVVQAVSSALSRRLWRLLLPSSTSTRDVNGGGGAGSTDTSAHTSSSSIGGGDDGSSAEVRVVDRATGTLFLDDADQAPDMVLRDGNSTFVRFEAARYQPVVSTTTAADAAATSGGGGGWVRSRVTAPQFAVRQGFVLHKVTLLGVDAVSTASVTVNGARAAAGVSVVSVGDDARGPCLEISGLQLLVGHDFEIRWQNCD